MDPETFPANTNSQGCYTAAQLAAALDVSKPAVLTWLKDRPSQILTMRGNEAKAWTVSDLPVQITQRLSKKAFHHGLSISDYLESSARPWEPKVPFSKAPPKRRQRAEQLKQALAASFARLEEGQLSKGEIRRLGVEDYRAVFHHEISESGFWKLLKRVERRARWDRDFGRPELYLEDDPGAGTPVQKVAIRDEFRPLRSLIEGILKKGNPDRVERQQIFDDAFQILEGLRGHGDEERSKRDLVSFLLGEAPFLAKTAAALRRNFDRLYRRWRESGRMLAGLDANYNGRARGPQLAEDERLALIAYAAKYGGGRDQGWREVIRAGKIKLEVVSYYAKSPRRMPKKIREQLTAYVSDAKTRMRGPRHAVLKGPYINRDPDHPDNPLHSGDWDQSDDYTFVNVMWDTLPDGSLWVGQPQLLLWTDERSWLPQGFVLIPDRNYNAFDIRNSWTAKCDEYGVPRNGLYLEGSFWQSARAWVGRKDEVSWSETEQGIRRLGVRITRAIYPRGKLIERIFKEVQNFLQAEPGYVGTNPITDKYEGIQKQIRLVKSGQARPEEFGWLSKAEWKVRFGELLMIYANEPREGKYLNGLSPKQAYEKHFSTELVKMPESCRYLLACNKIEDLPVGSNGLSFQFGKRRYTYKDERLGQMRMKNQRVTAWFNPENPEFCGVTDLNGENPIMVKRETSVPNHDAPAELLSEAYRENSGMEKHAKEVYAAVKQVFSTDFEKRRFRPVISDGLAVDTAAEFQRQGLEMTAATRREVAAVRRATRVTRELNMAPLQPPQRRPENVEALERLTELLDQPDGEPVNGLESP